MNKKYLLEMALMASMAFYSCTEEKIYVQGGEGSEQVAEDVQTITLQVENSGDGLTTRAGRPLYSAEAKQTIENVKVIVCNGTSVVYTKDFANWNTNNTSTAYTSGGHGREATIKLEGDEKLGQGSYTVYAIGYHTGSGYEDNAETTLNSVMTNITKGKTFNADMVLKYTGSSNAEEIFAGSAELSISDKKAGSATVILNRQVAGAFVYLKDIPYFEGATKIELVASTTNDQLVLGQFANTNFTSNGGNSVTMNVINGWNSDSGWTLGKAKETVIATITLSEWFNNGIKDDDTNGLIDTDNWKNPYTEDNHPTFQKGSVFAGTFLIPFAKVESTQTLKLVMKNGTDNQLAFWNVNLSSTGQNYSNLFTWNGSDWGTGATEALNKNYYSIVRNHLYGIGTRMNDQADPEKPGTDPEPGTEDPDDKPESLNNKQELILQVNDNWEVIHGMELE